MDLNIVEHKTIHLSRLQMAEIAKRYIEKFILRDGGIMKYGPDKGLFIITSEDHGHTYEVERSLPTPLEIAATEVVDEINTYINHANR